MAQKIDVANLPPGAPPANHGHTVAAWVAMAGVMLGVAVAGLGVAVAKPWLFVVGMVVVLVGLASGLVLRQAGFGQDLDRN